MILETFVANKVYNEYVDKVDNKEYEHCFFDYCGDLYQNYQFSPHMIIAIILSLML